MCIRDSFFICVGTHPLVRDYLASPRLQETKRPWSRSPSFVRVGRTSAQAARPGSGYEVVPVPETLSGLDLWRGARPGEPPGQNQGPPRCENQCWPCSTKRRQRHTVWRWLAPGRPSRLCAAVFFAEAAAPPASPPSVAHEIPQDEPTRAGAGGDKPLDWPTLKRHVRNCWPIAFMCDG